MVGGVERYRADTCSFLDWIYDTAQSHGHSMPVLRVDGLFRLDEFDSMTKTIVDARVSIPPFIAELARDAIKLRKDHLAWNRRQQRWASWVKADDRHRYFVNVLENLLTKLVRRDSNIPPTMRIDNAYVVFSPGPDSDREFDAPSIPALSYFSEHRSDLNDFTFEDQGDDDLDYFSDDFYNGDAFDGEAESHSNTGMSDLSDLDSYDNVDSRDDDDDEYHDSEFSGDGYGGEYGDRVDGDSDIGSSYSPDFEEEVADNFSDDLGSLEYVEDDVISDYSFPEP